MNLFFDVYNNNNVMLLLCFLFMNYYEDGINKNNIKFYLLYLFISLSIN